MFSVKSLFVGICTILFFLASSQARNELLNPKFELSKSSRYGDFSAPKGWNCIRYAEIAPDFSPQEYPPEPYQGNYDYWLTEYVEPVDGQLFLLLSTGHLEESFQLSEVTQEIELEPSQKLSFYYFFGTYDYTPFSDYAKVELISEEDSSVIDVLRIGVEDVGNYSSMEGWGVAERSFTAEDAGVYTLRIMITDRKDSVYDSYFAVDNIRICPSEAGGNLNDDCVVNFLDFAILAQHWLDDCTRISWCNREDGNNVDYDELANISENWLEGDYSHLCPTIQEGNLNDDCRVDFTDFATLLQNWLKDCDDVEWCIEGVVDYTYLKRISDNWLADGHSKH